MTAPLVVITGTGTGIGKTHLTVSLVRAWARLLDEHGGGAAGVAGLKPLETGVMAGAPSDRETLEQASTFHVKRYPPPYMLRRAVSPHLAAADEGVVLRLDVITASVATVRRLADGVVVELPGGLFSPLAEGLTNAEVAFALRADALLLIAPDRLGVLHDIGAATRAARAQGLAVSGIILVAPEHADTSTNTNAGELSVVTTLPLVAAIPRENISVTAQRPELSRFLRAFR